MGAQTEETQIQIWDIPSRLQSPNIKRNTPKDSSEQDTADAFPRPDEQNHGRPWIISNKQKMTLGHQI